MLRKQVVLVPLILALLSSGPPATSQGESLTASFARQANALVPDVIRITGLCFTGPIVLEAVGPETMRRITADDLALIAPGFSGDPGLRKAVYAAVQTIAVRYSLVQRRIYVCPAALDAGMRLASVSEPERSTVLRLMLAFELTRALCDQRFDLAGEFRRDRDAKAAICLRTLMDGYASTVSIRLACDWGVSRDTSGLAGSWCDGSLEKRDPALFPAYGEGPLQILGRNFVSSLQNHRGLPAIIRAFQQPPRQPESLLNPPGWLRSAFPPFPGPERLRPILLSAAGTLSCAGWTADWFASDELPRQLGTPPKARPFDLAWILGGAGARFTRPAGTAEYTLILIQWADPGRITPGDGLLRCLGKLRESAAVFGAALEPGLETAVSAPDVQIWTRQAFFTKGPGMFCPAMAAAGFLGPTTAFLTGYGEPVESRQAAAAVRTILEGVAALSKTGKN